MAIKQNVSVYRNFTYWDLLVERYFLDSVSNRMPNGEVDLLRQSPVTHIKRKAVIKTFGSLAEQPGWTAPGDALSVNPPALQTEVYNRAYARWLGKVRNGKADLGVTFASWRQSVNMISSRALQVAQLLADVRSPRAALQTARRFRRKVAREGLLRRDPTRVAGAQLEYQFGWVPLVQDINAALEVLTSPPGPSWVTAREIVNENRSSRSSSGSGTGLWYRDVMTTGKRQVTLAASVEVANQNLWLANRLGLINPATVAWDLVPWSFVVNMFLNINQILSSMTDMVGLSFKSQSTTFTDTLSVTETHNWAFPTQFGHNSERNACYLTLKERRRSVGSFSRPSLAVRVPQLNLDMAVTASSLMVQQSVRIGKLLLKS